MNAIEFFHYPWAESPTYPDYLVWGIRVDGTDLRALVGEATYPLWRAELAGEFDDEAEDEKETAEQVRTQHDGLGVPEFEDHHFRTQGTPSRCSVAPAASGAAGPSWPRSPSHRLR